ncbi:MAG: TonB-dependent receptor plug domain-containing protein, partial [Thiotrichaceae bacterium]|nr:TonB-dependent receptor plug domain-containing protein [Thiotrichaceae bacterium]
FTADLAAGNYELVFSYIGYSTEVMQFTAGSESNITVDATISVDVTRMDEVVITGTSTFTKKSQLGNSISTINSDDLVKTSSLSVDGALQGRVAGAQVMRNSGNPAGGVSVRLRGASTVAGSSDPLYIIDGVFVNNNSTSLIDLGGYQQNRLVDIDPQDIERIEILKGSAAVAIYGSRASNGVVQIFTKRGQQGKPTITFKSSVNFNQVRKTLPYNDAQLAWDVDNDPTQTISATRYNYQDYIFENSMGYDNYLSVSGGSNNSSYLISASRTQNDGIVKNTDFERNALRLRLDQKINDWAKVSIGSYVSGNKSHEMPNGKNYGPITSLLFADNLNDASPVDGVYPSLGWMANPYESVDRIQAPQNTIRSISDVQLKLTPFEGFVFNYTFGYDFANSEGLLFIPVGFNTKTSGVSEKATLATSMLNSDANMSYTTEIGSTIKSTTGMGYSYQYNQNDYFSIRTNNLGPNVTTTDAGTVTGRSDYR